MSAAPKLTGRVAENLDLIHALEREAAPTIKALADAVHRDASNVSKTLTMLAEDGFVHPEHRTTLTEAGHALRRAVGPAGEILGHAAESLTITHDLIDPDPDNERAFDADSQEEAETIDALRESILLRGLLQPLLLTEEPHGRYRLVAGERRWRAIGWAIDQGDWPADRPIPHRLMPAMDGLQRALARLAENLQREDLHWLDEAGGYLRLREGFHLADDEIADTVGRSKKHVQDYVRVLSGADAIDRRRARLPKDDPDHLPYRKLRDQLQAQNAKPKPAIEVTPEQALTLLEVAYRAQVRPSRHGIWKGSDGWTELPGRAPTLTGVDDATGDLWTRGFIVFGGHDDLGFARVDTDKADLLYWLVEHGYPDGLELAVWNARSAQVGSLEAGELRREARYVTAWLNAPEPTPGAEPNPVQADEPSDPSSAHPGDSEAQARSSQGRDDPVSAATPRPEPAAVPHSPAAARAHPSDVDLPDLSPLAEAAMQDVAHAIATGGVDGPMGAYLGAPCWNYYNDAAASQLLAARLVKFQPAANRRDWLVCLTDLGSAWIEALPDDTPMGPAPYATAWLNPPAPQAAPDGRTGPLAPMLGDDLSRQMREATGDVEPEADDLSLPAQIAFCESWLASGMAALGGDPDDTRMFEAIIASLRSLQSAEAS